MAFTFEMLLTLSLMIFAIIGYSTRKFPIDAVSISILGLLFLIFIEISSSKLVTGFHRKPL